MAELPDVKTYLNNCKIKDNVGSALERLLTKAVLPYNPYTSLLASFLGYSEYFVVAKSHLLSGSKRLKRNDSVTRVGNLYKSTANEPVWGMQKLLNLIDSNKIAQTVKLVQSFVKIPDEYKYAISLTFPSVFHKQMFGDVSNEISMHVDVLFQDMSVDDTVKNFAGVLIEELSHKTFNVIPLYLVVSSKEKHTFLPNDIAEKHAELQKAILASNKIQLTCVYVNQNSVIKTTKSFTAFRVWKKLGKMFCSSFGNPALLNLYQGVLVGSQGAEIYESILLQATYIEQEHVAAGVKEAKTTLSLAHPHIVSCVRSICNDLLSSSPDIDIFRFTEGLVLQCLLNADEEEELLHDIFYLFRSPSAKFYRLAVQYGTLEEYFTYSGENSDTIKSVLSVALNGISKILSDISYVLPSSPMHNWYAQCLENNIFVLEQMLNDRNQFQNIPAFLGVEKISCGVASLFFVQNIQPNLKCLNAKFNTEIESDGLAIKDHPFVSHTFDDIVHTDIPSPDVELGFYDVKDMNKPMLNGIDVSKNATKIQSAAHMHTIAVLMQYQSDMYIDTTIENVINSISTDYPPNPYNEFARECLLSSYKVGSGCISEGNLMKYFHHRPKLKDQEHQIYSIASNIFGLSHTVLQIDAEGIEFVLQVSKTIKNNPFITKKDGIRITHVVVPYPELVLCGKMAPMIYTIRCEEYYVMIKETRGADVETGMRFLTDMLILHLIDMSNKHIVIGYSVDDDDLTLICMVSILSKPAEKASLTEEMFRILQSRSLLSFEFFVKTELGFYVKVVKDIKPIFYDKAAEFYDHYTPCNPLNANFAVFSKLYPASFFYDYAEGVGEFGLEFIVNQLNRSIVDRGECWDVYQTIQLKYMLKEDSSFIPTAFYIAHSPCSRLHGLQQLNTVISDILINKLTTRNSVDAEMMHDMIREFVSHSSEILKEVGAGESLQKYVDLHLAAIYNGGSPVLEFPLVELLKSVYIMFSSLAQYFEKEYQSSSSYKLQPFVAEAASELRLS